MFVRREETWIDRDQTGCISADFQRYVVDVLVQRQWQFSFDRLVLYHRGFFECFSDLSMERCLGSFLIDHSHRNHWRISKLYVSFLFGYSNHRIFCVFVENGCLNFRKMNVGFGFDALFVETENYHHGYSEGERR